jgi:hypothetical protein
MQDAAGMMLRGRRMSSLEQAAASGANLPGIR